jgi:hypothetical protein
MDFAHQFRQHAALRFFDHLHRVEGPVRMKHLASMVQLAAPSASLLGRPEFQSSTL